MVKKKKKHYQELEIKFPQDANQLTYYHCIDQITQP